MVEDDKPNEDEKRRQNGVTYPSDSFQISTARRRKARLDRADVPTGLDIASPRTSSRSIIRLPYPSFSFSPFSALSKHGVFFLLQHSRGTRAGSRCSSAPSPASAHPRTGHRPSSGGGLVPSLPAVLSGSVAPTIWLGLATIA